jgi:hypothetical protein
VFASEEDGVPDILGIPGTSDQRRVPIDHGVEDATSVVVPGIAWRQEFALQSLPECADSYLVDSTRGWWGHCDHDDASFRS